LHQVAQMELRAPSRQSNHFGGRVALDFACAAPRSASLVYSVTLYLVLTDPVEAASPLQRYSDRAGRTADDEGSRVVGLAGDPLA
jgi:hypothetical protein